jgi:hypothetical protein
MTSWRHFGEDFGTWLQLDEVGDLAVSVWGQGTAYLKRDEVAELRDHLNLVLAGPGARCTAPIGAHQHSESCRILPTLPVDPDTKIAPTGETA